MVTTFETGKKMRVNYTCTAVIRSVLFKSKIMSMDATYTLSIWKINSYVKIIRSKIIRIDDQGPSASINNYSVQ